MSRLLRRLFASLFPGAADDDDDDLPDPNAELDEPGEPEDEPEEPEDEPEEPEDEPATRRAASRRESAEPSAAVQAAIARAERVERDLEDLKRATAGPTEDQRARIEEDRKLADPNVDALEKWQINANRTLRETQEMARRSLRDAHDMQDKTTFMSKVTEDPRRAKYADRVEKELVALRAKGQNVDRETLYFFQLGKDVATGKLKAASKKPSAAAAVPRGKTVSARSDVRSGQRSRSASGVRERLADKPI